MRMASRSKGSPAMTAYQSRQTTFVIVRWSGKPDCHLLQAPPIKLRFYPVHPHMLRHATGFKLANDGHDTRAIQQYLGHKNIQHTVRYTELASTR